MESIVLRVAAVATHTRRACTGHEENTADAHRDRREI